MKSKRRHELKTNELADQLGQWIARARPHTTTALIVVAGCVLVLAGWYFVASGQERKQAESWRSYMLASANQLNDAAEDLSLVADRFPDTPAGQWAALRAADFKAFDGMRLMFSDRAAAETALNTAKSHYRSVLESKPAAKDTMLSSRARFGLAQVLENQCELDKAKEEYERVVQSAGGTTLEKAAQERIDRLDTAAIKKWYNWFANQKPAPRHLESGPTSSSPALPPDSDLNVVPDAPTDDFLKDDTTVPATPAQEETPATPAQEETPAEPASG